MVPSLERGTSNSNSFDFGRMFDSSPGKEQEQEQSRSVVIENGVLHLVESTTQESQTQDSLGECPVESSRPMASRLISRRQEKQQSGNSFSQKLKKMFHFCFCKTNSWLS